MRGDIYRLRLDRGAGGHEQRGVRYGVLVQSDHFDLLATCLVAPTSTSARPATFRPAIDIRGQETLVLVEQTRAVDRSRLGEQVGRLRLVEQQAVEAALRLVLGL